MSTNGSTNNVTAIDVDMRDLLRSKKTGLTAMSTETAPDILLSYLEYQCDRLMRSIISLVAFKGCARSCVVMVIAFIAQSRNIRRLASR